MSIKSIITFYIESSEKRYLRKVIALTPKYPADTLPIYTNLDYHDYAVIALGYALQSLDLNTPKQITDTHEQTPTRPLMPPS